MPFQERKTGKQRLLFTYPPVSVGGIGKLKRWTNNNKMKDDKSDVWKGRVERK